MLTNTRIYANKYSSYDWDIMSDAYALAMQQIDRRGHADKDRLARCIMTLFDKGVREVGLLSSMAVHRQASLAAKQPNAGANATYASEEPMPPLADHRENPNSSRLLH